MFNFSAPSLWSRKIFYIPYDPQTACKAVVYINPTVLHFRAAGAAASARSDQQTASAAVEYEVSSPLREAVNEAICTESSDVSAYYNL